MYAPICSRNGVAFFGRDSDATLPVWSAKDGYPGDPHYREFHRDLGWDLPIEELNPGARPAATARPEAASGHRPQHRWTANAPTNRGWRLNG